MTDRTLREQVQRALDWEYQRAAAFESVRSLTGVRGVTNAIAVRQQIRASEVRSRIEAARRRSAEVDARRINVTVNDGTVVLSGHVRTWAEHREARHAAWSAPG